MPEIDIAPATLADEPLIVPLMVAFNEHEAIVWRPRPMRAALRRLIEDAALGVVLVARHTTTHAVVGYSLATFGYDVEFAGRDAFITELFVDAAHRRHGTGRALLDAMVERLRSHQTHAVHLFVRPENAQARALYETRDFRAVPRLVMTKVLDPEKS